MMSNAGWKPEHRTIVTIDIEGFGSPTRTDPIRAGLRRSLDLLISAALEKIGDPDAVPETGDTGDGKWMLFAPTLTKTAIPTVFLPALETELRHHNASASNAAKLRLRVGVHYGELIREGAGYAGEPLNHAFRIIDNDVARRALAAARANSVIVLSAIFYETIVRPGYGSLDPADYSPVPIHVKETATTVWIKSRPEEAPLPTPGGEAQSQARAGPSTVTRSEQTVLTIADLPPTSLYVAIADVHNAALYGRSFPEVPVQQHLETALLLGEKVAVHCADAYRSSTVGSILEAFRLCVEAGDLLFLLGENTQDPSGDFRNYIDYKVEQYRKSEYGERDVRSLTRVDQEAAERAERLLALSPHALIRGFAGTDAFVRAARHELEPGEQITIHEHFAASLSGRLSLSVRQLLDLTRRDAHGQLTRIVTDEVTVDNLRTEVDRLAGHNSFSRQIFMEAIRRATRLQPNDPLDWIFEERVSLVHLMSTLGSLRHLQVTNRRDRLSPYHYEQLLEHLSVLSEVPHRATFGPDLVTELRSLDRWWFFAAYHLRLVGDHVHRLASGEERSDLHAAYRWTRRISEFVPIRLAVRKHWK
jgi:hypothetical protein